MSSVRPHRRLRALAAGVLLLAAAGPLAGCSTTMQTAARLQLNNARIRASQLSVRVAGAALSATVQVQRLQLVTFRGRAAYVVTVRNRGKTSVSDLPISVGYATARHAQVYLNATANLSYFQAHLPAIGAGDQITWVYAGARGLPVRARPFALVGAIPQPPAGQVTTPAISASVNSGTFTGAALAVRVHNLSGIPQYQLPVYAIAQRAGRLVAAGTTSVSTLDGGSEQTVRLSLLGDADGARLTVEALPTIFN